MENRKPAQQELAEAFEKAKEKLSYVLAGVMPVERFITVATRHILENQAVVSCSLASVLSACLDAAEDGLLLNGHEAALVPRKGKASYQPMVWGLVVLAQRTGTVGSLFADVVRKQDSFRYWTDEKGAHLNHEPNCFEERGEMVGCYAVMAMKDGHSYIEVMNRAEVTAVKNAGDARGGSPWNGPFEMEMVKKSVIRRLVKRVPMGSVLDRATKRVDEFYDFRGERERAAQAETSALREQLRSGEPAAAPESIGGIMPSDYRYAAEQEG